MQNNVKKTVACAIIALMMAVLLGGHPTEPMTEGETVFDVKEVDVDAEMPRSASLPRRVVKRWAHILILRSNRRRSRLRSALIRWLPQWSAEQRRLRRDATAARFRGAVKRFIGAPRRAFDEWRDARIEPQCAVCGVHGDDGFAVDTTLKPAPLCIDCYAEPTHCEPSGLRAFAVPLCAAALLAIFAPQWVGLAVVGATRQPMPQWAKDATKAHGVKIRRHSKPNAINCKACTAVIAKGDLKAMLPLDGYAQNKPHCAACAQEKLSEPSPVPSPEPAPPTPAPTPTPTPAPEEAASWPPNRHAGKCGVCGFNVPARAGSIHPASPKGQKVRCVEHAGQPLTFGEGKSTNPAPTTDPTTAAIQAALTGNETNATKAAQLVALLASLGGVDPEEVRRIVKEETASLPAALDEVRTAAANGMKAAKDAALLMVEERLKELHAPVVLHIKTDDGPAIPAADEGEIIHRQEREILAKISALSKRNRAQNIMLHGDAGTGKTHMTEGVFKRLRKIGFFKGMEKDTVFHIESCNEEKQPSDLMGRLSPAFFDDGSGTPAGAWRFFAGAVMKAFCSPGILVFDEMDTLAPPSFSALNAMLANGFIIDPDGVKHYRHPRCVVIATANTTGNGANEDYTASHAQSLASLDRFAAGFVEVDFDPAIEDALAPTIAEDIRALRKVAKEKRCRRVVFSYRVMMNGEAQAQDFGKEYALSETVFQFGAENAAMLGFAERVPLPDDADMSGLAPMPAKARKAAQAVRKASFGLQSFNADTMTNTDTNAGGA